MVDEKRYLNTYDKVLLNSDIYLIVRDFHVNALNRCNLVLDSGCGTGNVAVKLLEQNHIVYAADESKEALNILKKKSREYKQRLKIYNINIGEELPFEDEKFGGITSMFVAHLISNIEGYLKEHYRVLKRNGIFVITGRMSKENTELVLKSHENSLRKRGLLPKSKRELNMVNNRLLYEVNEIMGCAYSLKEVKGILKNAGFRNIRKFPNPYFGQYYSLIAQK